jgi:D-beta-D-heptose 7-phosphate kinase/D-beta-D-heptose 1-phosphate adenosyltransferase
MNFEIPPFQQARILVVGDVMLDRYWHGKATRVSPEAPVPVVKVGSEEGRPGGAGNVALNLAALGSAASLAKTCSPVLMRRGSTAISWCPLTSRLLPS